MMPNLAAAWGVNDATAQIGVQFGRSAVAAGQDYVEKHVRMLSLHFNTNVANALSDLMMMFQPDYYISAVEDSQAPIQCIQCLRSPKTQACDLSLETSTVVASN
jgi:hypothetical protein